MKNITKENIEQWMYQNVEGELSSEQAEQLSTYIISNPSLENEFDNWNNAHTKNIQIEEYKNVSSIIKKKRFVWKNRYTFLLGLLIGTSIWIPFSFKNNTSSKKEVEIIQIPTVKKVKGIVKPEKSELKNEISLKNDMPERLTSKRVVVPKNVDKIELVSYPQKEVIEKIKFMEIDSFKKQQTKRKHRLRKVFYRPEKTKKELRKEKREARKPEIKYSKGNGPGVIPMNDLGF